MNTGKSNCCVRCVAIEDWSHIVKCASAKEMRDNFKKELGVKLSNIENARKDEIKWEWFVDNIIEYLNGGEKFRTTLWLLGFKELFQGYVVKDWFGHNE